MAKIKLSAVGITMMIGKTGGQIFARNKGGLYVKNFVKPSNPNTAAQQRIRAIFAGVCALWDGLSLTAKQLWKDAAVNFPVTDKFGDQLILTGRAFFQKVNVSLVSANQSAVLEPPVSNTGVPAFEHVSAELKADATCEIVDNVVGSTADPNVWVHMSITDVYAANSAVPPLLPNFSLAGNMGYTSEFKDSGGITPYILGPLGRAKGFTADGETIAYLAANVGKLMDAEVYFINIKTGQRSPAYRFTMKVVAIA